MKYPEIAKKAFDQINLKNYIDAELNLVKLLKRYPVDTSFVNALAFVKYNLNKIEDSISLLKKSLLINPNQIDCLQNLAKHHIELKKYDDALAIADEGIRNFKDPIFYYIKGVAFQGVENYLKAIDLFKQSIKSNPKFYDANINLAFSYNKNKDYAKAIEIYHDLLSKNIKIHESHYNLAIVYNNVQDYKNAIIHYEESLKINPNNNVAKFNLSLVYLAQMNFVKGWPLWESRWEALKKPEFAKKIDSCKLIDNNKKILIWGEQGIGEQILYGSMIHDLKDNKNLSVAINKRLITLYQRSFNNINFLDIDKVKDSYDSQIAMGSLGAFLRKDQDSFVKQPKKFLIADSEKSSSFKSMINSKNKIICGLSWISKNQFIGLNKSINLDSIINSLDKEKFLFVDLQYGNNKKERESIKNKYDLDIINLESLDKFNDIDGLVSLIDICDVVVSVSNITAHLSGALGKKTFMLAPHEYGSMWHWHFGSLSPWYPSIKIFRKKNESSWTEPLKELSEEIKKL